MTRVPPAGYRERHYSAQALRAPTTPPGFMSWFNGEWPKDIYPEVRMQKLTRNHNFYEIHDFFEG